MDTISRYYNKTAKNEIRKLNIENIIVNGWLNRDKYQLVCFMIKDEKFVKSFALISKNDYDPMNIHKTPYTLEYIFTFENFRKHGYAKKILNYIKDEYEITAFCDNQISESLFKSCGFTDFGDYNCCRMYRN